MAVETEHKFLVNGDQFINQAVDKTEITQTYLSTDPVRIVRVRIAGDKACLTIKSITEGSMLSRKEWEFPLDPEVARELMAVSIPGKILKTRYYVPAGKHMFEVDLFHAGNEGLVIAEVELSEPGEHFAKPDWLGREVTDDPAYYNPNLIK
ncbi:MAG: CYTH domain-containing protein [Bacteroidales bacterium]|nr:CYTH domain-containing protein [Bacteroidales bacterium]